MSNIVYTFGTTFKSRATHDHNNATSGDIESTLQNWNDVLYTESVQHGKPADFGLQYGGLNDLDTRWRALQPEDLTNTLLDQNILWYPDNKMSTQTRHVITEPSRWTSVGNSIQTAGTGDSRMFVNLGGLPEANPGYRIRLGTTDMMALSEAVFDIELLTDSTGAPTVTSTVDTTRVHVTIQVLDNSQTTLRQLLQAFTDAYYSQGVSKLWTFYIGEISFEF